MGYRNLRIRPKRIKKPFTAQCLWYCIELTENILSPTFFASDLFILDINETL